MESPPLTLHQRLYNITRCLETVLKRLGHLDNNIKEIKTQLEQDRKALETSSSDTSDKEPTRDEADPLGLLSEIANNQPESPDTTSSTTTNSTTEDELNRAHNELTYRNELEKYNAKRRKLDEDPRNITPPPPRETDAERLQRLALLPKPKPVYKFAGQTVEGQTAKPRLL